MTTLLLLFSAILLCEVQGRSIIPLLASESDNGAMVYRGNDKNVHFYTDKTLDGTDKIHVLVSIPDCACVAEADVRKINQLDYMLAGGHLFSFAFYVDSPGPCGLNTSEIDSRTSLRVSRLNSGGEVPVDSALFVSRHRMEGRVLAQGMRDFYDSAYISQNTHRIFDSDKSGGVLMMQGNVGLRPCKLFPWFMPWIYNDFSTYHLVEIGQPEDHLVYYDEAAASLVNQIITDGISNGIIKSKHLVNLEDNAGDRNHFYVFSFQAIFIPHRFAAEFRSLLAPFESTRMNPYVYVPLVMQMMFDKNEWIYMTKSTHNETLRVLSDSLLESCRAETVETMQISDSGSAELSWFASGYCGISLVVTVTHVVSEIETVTGRSVYMVLFFVLLSFCGCVFFCVYRRGFFRLCGLCYGRYIAYRPILIRGRDMHEMNAFKKIDQEEEDAGSDDESRL